MRGLLLLLVGLAACSTTSPEQYARLVEEARACEEAASCVLAGSSECICPMPVHGPEAERVEAEAERVDCNGAIVECALHDNVRCEAGRCISDQSP